MQASPEWVTFLEVQQQISRDILAIRGELSENRHAAVRHKLQELSSRAIASPPSGQQGHLEGQLGEAFTEWHDRRHWALCACEDLETEDEKSGMFEVIRSLTAPDGPRDVTEWSDRFRFGKG